MLSLTEIVKPLSTLIKESKHSFQTLSECEISIPNLGLEFFRSNQECFSGPEPEFIQTLGRKIVHGLTNEVILFTYMKYSLRYEYLLLKKKNRYSNRQFL